MHRTDEIGAGLLLPTPTAMIDEAPIAKVDARNQKQMEKGNSPFILGLGQQAMRGMLPTPTASDWKGGCTRTGENEKFQHAMLQHSIHHFHGERGKSSQLNPRFVAEMMGFPPNWTELPFLSGEQKVSKDTETP